LEGDKPEEGAAKMEAKMPNFGKSLIFFGRAPSAYASEGL